MKRKWIVITLCIFALVAAAIGIRRAVQAVKSPPADQAGPYKVGFVTKTYFDSNRSDFAGGARPIQTFIWYPAEPDNGGNPMPPAVYPITTHIVPIVYPDATSTDFEAYGIDPAFQEVAASQEGPFPLIILSPGQGESSAWFVQIGTRLASHGFVVAIPTNFDEKIQITAEMAVEPVFYPSMEAYTIGVYYNRIRDIQFLMTQLVEDSKETGNLLYGTILPDQIAVGGHSVGGGAALALAGGDDEVCDMMGFDPSKFSAEICGTITADPRVKAIAVIDGSNQFLHFAELSRIQIPHMEIVEEWNTLESVNTGLGFIQAREHAAIQSELNYRVDIANANHFSFLNHCAIVQVLNDHGIGDDVSTADYVQKNCQTEPVSPEEFSDLTTQYMIAFLKNALVRGTDYKEMLTTGYALNNEPFIEFFETEQGDPNEIDEDGYFSYFMHLPGTERAKALKDPF
jgi:predicted dienelactone hydrolase